MNIALDVNTILTSLVLMGIVYMVRSQAAGAEAAALAATNAAVALQRAETTEREMVELRARVATCEGKIAGVEITLARIQGVIA